MCGVVVGSLPHILGSHHGVEKTLDRINAPFYRPGVKRAVEYYCHSCPECQQVVLKPQFRSPLIPLPIISVPFCRIAMDLVGLLPKSPRSPIHPGDAGLHHQV